MKRVFVYEKNNEEQCGKVMPIAESLENFRKEISTHFKVPAENITLFASNGCEICDVRLLRDDEKVFFSIEESKPSSRGKMLEQSMANLSLGSDVEKPVISDWITLNVGGKHFTTSRSTLLAKEPLSMLARMFAVDNNVYFMNPSARDDSGAYLIDRSPEYFEPILNYLRHGDVILDNHVNPKGVLEEAVFYGKKDFNTYYR